MLHHFRDHRHFERRPLPDVPGSIVVGLGRVSASTTVKLILASTIGLLAMSTLKTSAGSVSRIDRDQYHTGQCSLVRQKQPELRECPTAMSRSLRSAKPFFCASSDAGEFFNGYSSPSAVSFGNDPFGDAMIHIGTKPTFAPSMASDGPVNRPDPLPISLPHRAGTAKPPTMFSPACADLIDLGIVVVLPVRVGGNVGNSKINAHETVDGVLFNVGKIDTHKKIEPPVTVNQVRFTTVEFEKFPLLVATNERDCLATVNRPDAHGRSVDLPREYTGIVADGPIEPERPLAFTVQSVGVGDLGIAPDDYLRRQDRELRTASVIGQLVQGELPKNLSVPCTSGKPIASGVSDVHRFQQSTTLIGICL